MFSQISKKAIEASSKAYLDEQKFTAARDRALEVERERTSRALRIQAAKMKAAQDLEKLKAGFTKENIDQVIARYYKEAAKYEVDDPNHAYYTKLAQGAFNMKHALATAGASARKEGEIRPGDVTGLPTNPPAATPTINIPGPPGTGGSPQTAAPPAAAVESRPVREALQKAGIPYEPNKYEYRLVDGKVQRKLKGPQ